MNKLNFILILLFSVIVLVSWKPIPYKQENCTAETLFVTTTAPFKSYGKDDYCIIVDISGSIDKNSPPTTFKWLTGDGQSAQGKKFEHCYRKAERYQLTLLATSLVNQVRLTDTSYYQVDISDFAIIDVQKNESRQCYFNAQESSLGKGYTITNYYWDFGDGHFSCATTNPLATHQYATAGTYQLRLIVNGKSKSGKEKRIYSKKTITIAP